MGNMTAKVSCFARAYHYKNNTSHIFADSMAEALLGEDYRHIAESMAGGAGFFLPGFNGTAEEGLRLIVDLQLSPSVLGRSAFCEELLRRERARGCRQYVIFAAGYDTFALRNADEALTVFELDLPEMSEEKRARVKLRGLSSCAVYVPCDLMRSDWSGKLLEKGYAPEKKSFGSLLGLSYYLEKSEWRDLLRSVSGIMTRGSVICFDYPSVNGSGETEINSSLAKGAGEEMKAKYAFGEMEAVLEAEGFRVTEQLESGAMERRYFSEYNADNTEHAIKAPVGVCYVSAVKE